MAAVRVWPVIMWGLRVTGMLVLRVPDIGLAVPMIMSDRMIGMACAHAQSMPPMLRLGNDRLRAGALKGADYGHRLAAALARIAAVGNQ